MPSYTGAALAQKDNWRLAKARQWDIIDEVILEDEMQRLTCIQQDRRFQEAMRRAK